ncbi:hypothetical protein ACFQ9P_15860, partial [Streptomyces sp. NPDC056543]
MYDRASSRAAKKRDASADRTSAARAVAPAESLLDLQRSAGNAAVVQMLRRAGVAPEENPPSAGCGYEQEDGTSVPRSSVHNSPL